MVMLLCVGAGYSAAFQSPALDQMATSSPTARATRRPESHFYEYTRERYIEEVEYRLETASEERDIRAVDVIDEREVGGQRTLFVTFVPSAYNQDVLRDEVISLFRRLAAIIDVYPLDLDVVTLILVIESGETVGTITAQGYDLELWIDGDLTNDEMLGRVVFFNAINATSTAAAQATTQPAQRPTARPAAVTVVPRGWADQ